MHIVLTPLTASITVFPVTFLAQSLVDIVIVYYLRMLISQSMYSKEVGVVGKCNLLYKHS